MGLNKIEIDHLSPTGKIVNLEYKIVPKRDSFGKGCWLECKIFRHSMNMNEFIHKGLNGKEFNLKDVIKTHLEKMKTLAIKINEVTEMFNNQCEEIY